jgi:FKBP-type peptidyl-prolyl cis-trans isomerase SlyD
LPLLCQITHSFYKKENFMIIAKDKVVSVTYELKLANGTDETVEKVNQSNPLVFILGHGNLLPKFESNLTGLKIGDFFDFTLTAEEAYGKLSNEAIVDLPKSVFMVDGELDEDLLQIGNLVPMMDQAGNRFNGKVIELSTENVKMDFNHPLAGEALHFKGEVVEIREATDEEIAHGHIHQHSSCGCGSSDGCDSEGCGSGSGCESGSCGCN